MEALDFLDLKTMVFMAVTLTLLLSALLVLARVHAGVIGGLGYWALGNLAASLGMIVIVTQFVTPAHMIPGTALLALGNGLYICGIQAFKEHRARLWIPAGLFLLVAVVDCYFLIVRQDIRSTVIANALIFMGMYSIAAKMLLIKLQPPSRTAYWFAGLMFVVMALLMVVRVIGAVRAGPEVFEAMSQWPINKLTFFVGILCKLSTTFGFVLMLNYRMDEKLRQMGAVDWLTGAMNRRTLEDAAARMGANCKRLDVGLGMLMLDLDNFKQVNDQYGHQFGDEVLRQFAESVRGIIREGDLFGRYGGEEFCILLPHVAQPDALALGERIRLAFSSKLISYRNQQVKCTVSIGYSDSSEAGYSFHQLFNTADTRLYTAKQQGRNQVVAHTGLFRQQEAI
jgi:diguanylate cyclase (GGDEF)-like protein